MAGDKKAWDLVFCSGYIVPPCRGDLDTALESVKGSDIEVAKIPKDFFSDLFVKSEYNCKLGIAFKPTNGQQRNEVRDLIRQIALGIASVKSEAAKSLAVRLATVTRAVSREGLFVVLSGNRGNVNRVILFKFPADTALRANLIKGTLRIDLLQDTFSQKEDYFKAAMFEGLDAETEFWRGKVEDKQANRYAYGAAKFWVYEFLRAVEEITSAHGTRVLADEVTAAVKKSKDYGEKDALLSAATSLKAMAGRNISIGNFARNYLPSEYRERFLDGLVNPAVKDSLFQLDLKVLDKELKFKYLYLEGDFAVKGPLPEFDDRVTVVRARDTDEVTLSIKGKITGEDIRKR